MQTKEGAKKARDIMLKKFGKDYYAKLGRIGGKQRRPETRPFYNDRDLARRAGRKGGSHVK